MGKKVAGFRQSKQPEHAVENDSVFQRKTLTCIRGRKQRKFLFLSFFCETKKQRKFDTECSTKLKGIGLQRQRIQNFRGSSNLQSSNKINPAIDHDGNRIVFLNLQRLYNSHRQPLQKK